MARDVCEVSIGTSAVFSMANASRNHAAASVVSAVVSWISGVLCMGVL